MDVDVVISTQHCLCFLSQHGEPGMSCTLLSSYLVPLSTTATGHVLRQPDCGKTLEHFGSTGIPVYFSLSSLAKGLGMLFALMSS